MWNFARRLFFSTLFVFLLGPLGSRLALAQAPAPVPSQTIQYKSDGSSVAAEGVRVFAILAAVLAIAAGALWYVKRKYPALALGRNHGARINVVETRRVTPRLSLSLVEVDGASVLLAQSGDRVSSVLLPPRTNQPSHSDSQGSE